MNTEILFKNFHKKSKQEIYDLMKKFIDDDFFNTFPELKNDISVIITGSIAHNMYDKESDIDLTLVFHNEKKYKLIKFLILDQFKNKNLEPKRKPIELHGQNITSLKKLQADL
jgi:predicted nucleotidyltransferase